MLSLKAAFSHRVVCFTSVNLTRHFKRKPKLTKDPGIGARKQLVSLISDQEAETIDFDDLESDFMGVHKSHKEHLREMELVKEKEKYHLVKQKYFKEKFPNFLTWHDKEQIRYLYRTDPEEWTIERLSEGFPALPETIQKIAKSNWTKTKQNKITNHDISVQKNWKLFKEGQMSDLPEDLVEHLKKFTDRTLNFKPFVLPEAQRPTFEVKNNNIGTEFSDIITSYKKIETKHSPEIEEQPMNIKENSKPPLKETYVTSQLSKRSRLVTLDQLQDDLKKKVETGKDIDQIDKVIVMNLQSQENRVEKNKTELVDLTQDKYQTSSGVQTYKKTERDLSHLNYPEKINIPKTIFKKGFIYKLNDCYYDDDGEFLYRVPGMG